MQNPPWVHGRSAHWKLWLPFKVQTTRLDPFSGKPSVATCFASKRKKCQPNSLSDFFNTLVSRTFFAAFGIV
jgi:hypothetical protein